MYFVTICTHEKKCLLGRVAGSRVEPSRLGQVAAECWLRIPEHFPRVQLDAFVVMPNHLHGVLVLHRDWKTMRAQHAAPLRRAGVPAVKVAPASLAAIVRSFKSAVTRRARQQPGFAGPIWQRNYYEHIIRNGEDLCEIRRYIWENPQDDSLKTGVSFRV